MMKTAKLFAHFKLDDTRYPWKLHDDTGRFREGHSRIENAIRAHPALKISRVEWRDYLTHLDKIVAGRLVDPIEAADPTPDVAGGEC